MNSPLQSDMDAVASRSTSRWLWFYKLASPPHAYRLLGALRPWLLGPSIVLMFVAAWGGLFIVPQDYQQKDAFRIVYVHAPIAILSVQIYAFMAISAAIGLIWRIKLAHAVATATAPIGAWIVLLTLATGSIYGKPMWGTWWEWEPRLTSVLVLLFMYLGYMGLRSAFDDTQRADRASAVLAIIGVIDVPIVKYSVEWWNSLHQGPTLSKLAKPSMDPSMIWPWVLMGFALCLYIGALLCDRVRAEILVRERNASWLDEQVTES